MEIVVLGEPEAGAGADSLPDVPIVRVRTGEGVEGVAEVFGVPVSVAAAALDGRDSVFGARLIGGDADPTRVHRLLLGSLLHGDRAGWAVMCIGAVDAALWDIEGKRVGAPVHAIFGGPTWPSTQVSSPWQHSHVRPYATVYAKGTTPAEMVRRQLASVETLVSFGYRGIKIEPMRSEPAVIIELARETRRIIGDLDLMVDVGYLWNDLSLVRRVAEELAEFRITWLETPFPTTSLAAYRRLCATSPVPIALGEYAVTADRAIEIMDAGVEVVQPYVTMCGGFSEMRRIVDAASPRGIRVCPGGWGTQVQAAANVHVAAWSLVSPWFEYVPPEIYTSHLRRALAEHSGPKVVNGLVQIPDAPGLGFDLDEKRLSPYIR